MLSNVKTAFCALVLTFSLLQATPSYSFNSTTVEEQPRQILLHLGEEFQSIADSLGFHNFRQADFTGKHSAALTYSADASRTLGIDYFSLSGDAAKDTKLLETIRAGLYRQFYEASQILTASSYDDPMKGPVMYIEFRAGKGDAKQYGAGILFRVSATGAAFIQIQSKGQAFEAADGQRLQDLVKTVVALK